MDNVFFNPNMPSWCAIIYAPCINVEWVQWHVVNQTYSVFLCWSIHSLVNDFLFTSPCKISSILLLLGIINHVFLQVNFEHLFSLIFFSTIIKSLGNNALSFVLSCWLSILLFSWNFSLTFLIPSHN
jgi:hypothetical protein